MVSNRRQMPVIVLMDSEASDEQAMIRQWLEDSRFSTCEASDVFEALEHLSDFTISARPDVILLDSECSQEQLPLVRDVSELPVMTISEEITNRSKNTEKYSHASFGQFVSRLNELIPQ